MSNVPKPTIVPDPKLTHQEIGACIAVLENLAASTAELAYLTLEQRVALMIAAGKISRPDKDVIRIRKKD